MEEGSQRQEEAVAVEAPASPGDVAREGSSGWTRVRREIGLLTKDIGIAIVLCIAIVVYVIQPFTVEGTSMLATLEDGQRIIVNKFMYHIRQIERGDIVVFYYPLDPNKSFIKRVIGLPGDTVEIGDGFVYVNGEKLEEPYILRKYREHEDFPEVQVQPGFYYVLGDHRNGSNDSRAGWLVPQRYIYGKAFLRYWPPSRVGSLH